MKKYVTVRNHRADLLTEEVICKGLFQHIDVRQFGFKFRTPSMRYVYPSGNIDWIEEEYEAINNTLLEKEKYTWIVNHVKETLSNFHSYIKKFKVNMPLVKGNLSLLLEFFDNMVKVGCLVGFFAFEQALDKKLEEDGININSIKPGITDTTNLTKELVVLAEKYPLEFKNFGKASKELKQKLSILSEKYSYLGMKYFFGKPLTQKDLFNMLENNIKKKEPPKEHKKSFYLNIIEQLLELRTRQWEAMCYGGYLFREMIIKYFPKIDHESLLWLTMDEVIDALYNNSDYKKISSSRKVFILEVSDKGVKLITENIKDEDLFIKNTSEIKGQCAYPGLVKGTVKVVFEPKECSKINSGDVLVATMSTPDFLGGMLKASAFVTDIGGITSHVAIVARELQKPCIIGTKFATRVLKDGDLIEVNANTGIITILEKAK